MAIRYIKGLLDFRKNFTDIFEHVKSGEEVHILHMGQNRKAENGYKLVKMTDEELASFPNLVVKKDIPKVELKPRIARRF